MRKYKKAVFQIILLSFFCGCSPSSHQDFVHEADRVCQKIIKDLKKIQHSQDLASVENKLHKDFSELVELLISARKAQIENPDQFFTEILECPSAESFRQELIRVYGIEGGRQAVEKAQREALARLDRFERQVYQKNSAFK